MPFDMSAILKKTRKLKAGVRVRRRATIVLAICDVIREDRDAGITPTLLNHEGAIVASLRSGLCLEGIPWHEADSAARDVVREAFARAGAKRPTWKEGQREHTDGGVIRQTRTTCANCEKPLEPEQKIYCCKTCFDAHRARLYRLENLDKMRALDRLKNLKRREAGRGHAEVIQSERWKDARDKANRNRS